MHIACTDVDECLNATIARCDSSAVCNNLPGSYTCECPSGSESNGETGLSVTCTSKFRKHNILHDVAIQQARVCNQCWIQY